MGEDRLHLAYRAMAKCDGDRYARLAAVCHASIDTLGVAGAAVMLVAERVHQGTIYSTNPRIQELEDLQNVAAEGPCIDAYTLGRPVLEPDLAGRGLQTWPILARGALEAGMGGLFSFPLSIDDTCMGALNLYRDEPGAMSGGQIDDARLLAAMAAREVLGLQADAAPGTLPSQVADLSGDRVSIEQATGMAAAQLAVTIVEAATRLRQVATRQDRHLVEVARDIVSRRMTLEPDSDG